MLAYMSHGCVCWLSKQPFLRALSNPLVSLHKVETSPRLVNVSGNHTY
jgi:hypothetical protein